jgi:hypothetical protein
MRNALCPFATQHIYTFSVCDKFIQGLDHRILGLLCRVYPNHSAVHNLNDAYTCYQLLIDLAAAQVAEDEVKTMQDIARGMLGQGFYLNIIGGGMSPQWQVRQRRIKTTVAKTASASHQSVLAVVSTAEGWVVLDSGKRMSVRK